MTRYITAHTTGILIMALLMTMAGPYSYGEAQPEPTRLDQRVRIIPYEEGQIYTILTHEFVATVIEFGEDEQILENVPFILGDVQAWDVITVKPNAISVKPIKQNPRSKPDCLYRSAHLHISPG